MMYNIQMKNDISSGAVLTVRFPEDDIDKKALYTIERDILESWVVMVHAFYSWY